MCLRWTVKWLWSVSKQLNLLGFLLLPDRNQRILPRLAAFKMHSQGHWGFCGNVNRACIQTPFHLRCAQSLQVTWLHLNQFSTLRGGKKQTAFCGREGLPSPLTTFHGAGRCSEGCCMRENPSAILHSTRPCVLCYQPARQGVVTGTVVALLSWVTNCFLIGFEACFTGNNGTAVVDA